MLKEEVGWGLDHVNCRNERDPSSRQIMDSHFFLALCEAVDPAVFLTIRIDTDAGYDIVVGILLIIFSIDDVSPLNQTKSNNPHDNVI